MPKSRTTKLKTANKLGGKIPSKAENPIQITSPMDTLPHKHPEKKNRTPLKGGLALLQVSKAMHQDAAQNFYEHNNFVIGSPIKHMQYAARFVKGCRSSIHPNHHGLQSFLSRVPRFYINCIRELTILTSVAILTEPYYCACPGQPPISYLHMPKTQMMMGPSGNIGTRKKV
ncbi:predicted protein [Sclerotinia sclerotiorum 1980 UF-70]|uniref:Uncharacterized protein n=1 Tax=Sclerotinia sclerotiorum (strain ATCC 18683 / 1980 / Ss-1) TaxID=665079 RepID=A7EM44_SCLS1|nr:predicted protein [Sclerotinia sclerotiorum 1980 UF-70]EDO03910.1 predicted protein [Sclerotinia sclerotiorum 1980 UF-70]